MKRNIYFFWRLSLFRNARWPALTLVALLVACTDKSPNGSSVTFSNFQNAIVVIGQPDFVHNEIRTPPAADTVYAPFGRAMVSGRRLYLPDSANHRLLILDSIPTTNGAVANLVVGQPDFQTAVFGSAASQLHSPITALAESEKLLVVDKENDRIIVFKSTPAVSGAAADSIIGWDDFNSNPTDSCAWNRLAYPSSAFTVNGKLIVADSGNNRVLIWNKLPTKNDPADMVLGQSDFTQCASNAGRAADGATLSYPTDVWSDGTRLIVADSSNGRVLIWNSFPKANGQVADLVLGQTDLTSRDAGCTQTRMASPRSVSSNGTQLFVADFSNNRVLGWNTFPVTNGAPADVVLGQGDFTHHMSNDDSQVSSTNNPPPTARTLSAPAGVALWGNQLFVTDKGNNRYLIFSGK